MKEKELLYHWLSWTWASKEKWGLLKEQSGETLAMFWSHSSFVSYLSVKFLFDVLSPSPIMNSLCSFREEKLHNPSFQNFPFYFSDTCNQSKLFMVAQTIKFKQIWWLFPQLLLLWTKRGKGQEKATSLMTHYVLWCTWNFKCPEHNLFLFYVSHPGPHLPQ